MAKAVVCVFCGSSPGKSPAHLAAAKETAELFHRHDITLVYGGGTTGLMGEVARTLVALSGPSAVRGIIPSPLISQEQRLEEKYKTVKMVHDGKEYDVPDPNVYGSTEIVASMHERKEKMAKCVLAGGKGSGFVALSGGFGTLEELLEVTTWNQLSIHDRPVIAINIEGYYDGLFAWVRGAVSAGFIKENQDAILVNVRSPKECVQALQNYQVSDERLDLEWGLGTELKP